MARDPYRYFRIEARELVDGLAQGILELEKGKPPREVVARVLRLAHTLKGAAHVVRQPRLAELAHAAEEILSPHRETHTAPAPDATARLLAIVDDMERELASLQVAPAQGPTSEPERGGDPGSREAPAPSASSSPSGTEERIDTVRVGVSELDSLLFAASETAVTARSIRRQTSALEELARSAASLAEALGGRDDALAGRALELGVGLTRTRAELLHSLDRAERQVASLQESADHLRLVPSSAVFPAVERVIRDAAHLSGREVDLVTRGGDSRIDGEVLAAVREALLQLARNAVVHGIEPGDARRAAGKPARGRVELSVDRQGGQVVFAFRDDGRGLDLAAIARTAVERGLLPAGEAGSLSVAGAAALLQRGGVSTASAVTEIAGRGVGLDVVRDVVARLRGSIAFASEPGQGVSITLRVAVSLSSVASLVVEADSTTCSLPLDSIVRAIRLDDAHVFRAGGRESILEDGVAIPFAPLSELVGTANATRARRSWSTLIVRDGEGRVAVGADRVLGVETVVVRALPPVVGAIPGVSGASLDELGDPRLALDAPGLAEAVRRRTRPEGAPVPARRAPVLVIDDSLTTRMLEQSILESAGYEVVVATSAEEGLEKARATRFGVFVVDVEMPGIDGFEFVARTRADPELARTPAILVTSRGAPEDRRRGVAAGARAYIVKDEFDQDRLLTLVRELNG